jgi:hypothetical protein
METIRITPEMIRQSHENYGANKFLKWAQREESGLSTLEKVKLQAEMKSFLRSQGITEGKGR